MKLLKFLCGVILSLSLTASIAANTTKHISDPVIMQKTPPDYTKEWKIVDSLVDKGLPQSALVTVRFIYNDAKAKQNSPQFLKAILYKLRLESDYQEDYLVRSIDTLKLELKNEQGNIKAILHSMIAELYWSYYQSNRYNFLNRTQTVNFVKEDIHTWTARDLIDQVISHYVSSLESPGIPEKG